MKPIISLSLVSALALVSACTSSNDRVLTQFFREAGSVNDSGSFGNATLDNTLIQTGERSYAQTLNSRFNAEVPATVNFDFNSAQLDAGAQQALMEQANFILQFPEARFRVYGHTDLVGSRGYNRRLGQRRANVVVNFLVAQGISRSRLEAVASFGETQPVVVTEGRERRNRRTVTEVTGFVGSHPLVLDGKYAQIVYRDYITSAQSRTQLTGVASASEQLSN